MKNISKAVGNRLKKMEGRLVGPQLEDIRVTIIETYNPIHTTEMIYNPMTRPMSVVPLLGIGGDLAGLAPSGA